VVSYAVMLDVPRELIWFVSRLPAERSMATNNRPLPRNTVAKKAILAVTDPIPHHPDEP
jgi:hypothetical protein